MQIIIIPDYFQKYLALVPDDLDAVKAYAHAEKQWETVLGCVQPAQYGYAYAVGKWTMREKLLHVIDTERIFCYRALRIARGDQQNQPGFDENSFAANSHANTRGWDSLLQENKTVSTASLTLIESFSASQLNMQGLSNNEPVNVRGIIMIMAGHKLHHCNIARDRYGIR